MLSGEENDRQVDGEVPYSGKSLLDGRAPLALPARARFKSHGSETAIDNIEFLAVGNIRLCPAVITMYRARQVCPDAVRYCSVTSAEVLHGFPV
jgi:hypothetical protein